MDKDFDVPRKVDENVQVYRRGCVLRLRASLRQGTVEGGNEGKMATDCLVSMTM